MAFEDLSAELAGRVPGYSIFLAEKAIARAWQAILRKRTWSFLLAEGAFNAPALINAGSVTTSTNSAVVTVSALADAALNGLTNPLITARQFRVGFGGSIYNIAGYNHGLLQLTLDRPFLEPGAANQPYEVYQCYFPPPPQALLASGIYDFNRWISVIDATNGYKLSQQFGKEWLDRRDPQRTAANLAYIICDYKADAAGNMLYEFWPHPTAGQTFTVLYKKKGAAVITGQEPIPDIISEDLITDRALYMDAFPWAATNAGRDPALAKVNWGLQQQLKEVNWRADLQSAKLEDDNINLQSLLPTYGAHNAIGPIDATFIQSHDMGGFLR
jgi:hypothetical protein